VKKMNRDDIERGNNPSPSFTMSDMESHIGQVNLNNQISDRRWDSIIKTLNSDFPLHNASPEAICNSVKEAVDKVLVPKPHSHWDILWTCGIVLIMVASASLLSWAFIEVMRLVGG
jgi:hypothetical protein